MECEQDSEDSEVGSEDWPRDVIGAVPALLFVKFVSQTLTVLLANSLSAAPCFLKMSAFALSRSPRVMPGPRGRAPMSSATSQFSKAVL